MCVASKMFDQLPTVTVGEVAEVAKKGDHMLFARHGTGGSEKPEYCCIRSGSTVLLQAMPKRLQSQLDIGPEVAAVMISPDLDLTDTYFDRDDAFEIVGSGKRFFLRELEVGMTLAVIPAVQETEETPAVSDGAIDRELQRIVAEGAANSISVRAKAKARERELALTR